jgi:hypothetical protein
VLDVYARPYDPKGPVVNLDESPRQLISEVREGFTDSQGVEYFDTAVPRRYEYAREGVADLYMILEAKAGRREVLVQDNHNRFSYAEALIHIAEVMYPEAEKITLIEDNLSAHKLSALYEVFAPERARAIIERIEVVRTPKHGSWLNVAELELNVLTRQGLQRRVATKEALREQVTAWYEQRNDKGATVDWQFTTRDARIKLKRLYPKM